MTGGTMRYPKMVGLFHGKSHQKRMMNRGYPHFWNPPSAPKEAPDEAEKNGKVMLRLVAQGRPVIIP